MEKVLEKKKARAGSVKSPEVKQKPIVKTDNMQLEAIENLTKLNGSLVNQIRSLSSEIDNLKDRVAQVASRLGL